MVCEEHCESTIIASKSTALQIGWQPTSTPGVHILTANARDIPWYTTHSFDTEFTDIYLKVSDIYIYTYIDIYAYIYIIIDSCSVYSVLIYGCVGHIQTTSQAIFSQPGHPQPSRHLPHGCPRRIQDIFGIWWSYWTHGGASEITWYSTSKYVVNMGAGFVKYWPVYPVIFIIFSMKNHDF